MTRGRPPRWNPFADVMPGIWTEALQVTSKDRVSLPAAVRKRLEWLAESTAEGLLATLDIQQKAELSPWSPYGKRAIADVAQRLEMLAPRERDETALAAMDRYMRLAFEPPGRVLLPSNLIAHIDPQGSGSVRVVVMHSRLWLWSEEQWQTERADRIRLLRSPL